MWELKPKPDLEKMEEDILSREQWGAPMERESFPILENKPELFSDLVWIWEGFMCLTKSRQYGFGAPQPISIGDVNAYCEYRRIEDDEDRDDFLYHVQCMDSVFIKDWREKQPKTPPGGKAPKGLGQA